MASTTSPSPSRTDQGSDGSRSIGDLQIAAQRQPRSTLPRSVTDLRTEEARRRSEEVQAATDIAAGW